MHSRVNKRTTGTTNVEEKNEHHNRPEREMGEVSGIYSTDLPKKEENEKKKELTSSEMGSWTLQWNQ